MFDWDDLRYVLAIERAKSLARAANDLGIADTTVGRRLVALEEKAGAKLFDRTPDGWVLTPAGRAILPRAERMEAEALALEREVKGADGRLEGSVRVTATEVLATRFIAPHIHKLAAAHPHIALELVCTNEVLSLARREADIALRLSRPREDDVITKELAPIPLALYASKSYVEQHGTPEEAERSLAGHTVVMFAATRHFRWENDWFEARAAGAHVALRSDSVSSIVSAVIAGLGIALLPRAVADPEPSLVRIETTTAPRPRTIWETIHKDMRKTARVRAVTDFLEEILRL
jgi:DNA-binding transcriptional LysR family regulator